MLGMSVKMQAQTNISAQLSNFKRKTPLMGLNANAIYYNTWTNVALADSVKNLNPSILRYPGGTPGNYWNWSTGWPSAPFSSCYPNGPSPALTVRHNELKIGLDSCHAEMLYTLNLLNSNLSNQLQGINYASSLSIPIKYIEFGNEHNLTCDPISSTTYASMSKTWADTIKAQYPSSKICLVGGDVPSSAPNWISDITAQNVNYDALSFHVYPLPSSSIFNVKNALSIAYKTTGQRYSTSHFSNVPTKEVWVTEYNISSGNTALTNTWCQSLFILSMFDTLIQQNQVTMMLPWAYSGPNAYFQSLDYNNFSMKATGLAVKVINDMSRGLDSCQKIKFTPTQYQIYNGISYPLIFGYKFYNSISSKAMFVNISSTNYNLDVSSLSNVSYFKIFSADTALVISNGFQSVNYGSGSSNIINMPPFSVAVVDFSLTTGIMDLLTNKNNVEVYPNPVANSLKLKNIDANKIYKIYNINGQLEVENIYNGNTIDVSRLVSGIYFVVTHDKNDNSLLHAKFIKE